MNETESLIIAAPFLASARGSPTSEKAGWTGRESSDGGG